jgi:alkanesulfonate monooxygenase SsuD/methylene tetrahydromethanopterin reductase-like flavin-dependent oxidoreductase (luciferase family)
MGFAPKPVRPGRPPTLIGGFADAALRRAARYDGWCGYVSGAAEVTQSRSRLERFRDEAGTSDRPFEMVAVHLGAPDREELDALVEAGLDRVIVTPWQRNGASELTGRSRSLDTLAEYAQRIGLSDVRQDERDRGGPARPASSGAHDATGRIWTGMLDISG